MNTPIINLNEWYIKYQKKSNPGKTGTGTHC